MRKKAAQRISPYLEMNEDDLKTKVRQLANDNPQDLGELTDLMRTHLNERENRFAQIEQSISKDSPNRESLLNLKRPDVESAKRKYNIFLEAFAQRHEQKQKKGQR